MTVTYEKGGWNRGWNDDPALRTLAPTHFMQMQARLRKYRTHLRPVEMKNLVSQISACTLASEPSGVAQDCIRLLCSSTVHEGNTELMPARYNQCIPFYAQKV
jgi:hypothetical protein